MILSYYALAFITCNLCLTDKGMSSDATLLAVAPPKSIAAPKKKVERTQSHKPRPSAPMTVADDLLAMASSLDNPLIQNNMLGARDATVHPLCSSAVSCACTDQAASETEPLLETCPVAFDCKTRASCSNVADKGVSMLPCCFHMACSFGCRQPTVLAVQWYLCSF